MKLILAASLAIATASTACGDRKSQPQPAAAVSTAPKPPVAAAAAVIPEASKQLVTAIADDWTSTKITLHLWTRTSGAWQVAGESWPGVIGTSGAAWGIGLHGIGAPNREGPLKKEGDGKSPAGAFELRAAYGVADEPPAGSHLPYESTARGDWECVDDTASEHYGKIVDRKQVPSDWESTDPLLRDDALYTWVVEVAHNPERTPARGSCIFLHVWGGKSSTTVGCTAMAEKHLVQLIAKLDPALHPVFVLLPRAEYSALAPAWGLPAL